MFKYPVLLSVFFLLAILCVSCSKPGKEELICSFKKQIEFSKTEEYKNIQAILLRQADAVDNLKEYQIKYEAKQLEFVKSCGFKDLKEFNEVYLEYYSDPEVKDWFFKMEKEFLKPQK